MADEAREFSVELHDWEVELHDWEVELHDVWREQVFCFYFVETKM